MDSPESNQIVSTSPSPAVQDSPFFSYLSNLSPIKPVKAVHVAQGFSELNFPPPPPVFTSPRINPQRGTSFLKRPQISHSSNAEFSQHGDGEKMFAVAADVSLPSAAKSTVELIPCFQREFDSKCSVQVQPCSPSGSIDEYLADPVEVDSVNSVDSADLCMKQPNDVPQSLRSGCSGSGETVAKLDDDIDIRKVAYTEVASSLTSLEQAEKDLLKKSLFSVSPVETETEQQKDGGRLSDECPGVMSWKANNLVESELLLEPVSGTQNGENVGIQVAMDSSLMSKQKEHEGADFDKEGSTVSTSHCHDTSQDVKMQNAEGVDCSTLLLPESLQIAQEHEDRDENSGAISSGSVEKRMQYEIVEDSQHQRGMRRRCLQFEAAEASRNILGNSCSRNPTNTKSNLRSPPTPSDLEVLDACHHESSATSSVKQMVDKSDRDSIDVSITAPMPSGIGLHLNSIINAVAMGPGATASMNLAEKNYPNVQGKKSLSVINHRLTEDSKSNSSVSIVGNFSANNDDDRQESQITLVASSATSHSSHSIKAVKNAQQLKLTELHMTPCGKRKSASENSDRFEELNQLSPKKKRKRASYTNENEGCKRCNCKRSKCLKLYCECFAAGVYCADPCACQECFNKPEYEDTVLGTRQQIESRNPLAFAPKIVQRFTESPANSGEDSNRVTPSSARHKRGCNCKKSMCLKKYCECYQAGVGCSDGCRCEGCKNIFGVKEGYGEMVVYRKTNDERWEGLSDEKLDMEDTRSDILHPHNLSPLTPSFQCSNHGKDKLKSRVPAKRYLPSPESETTVPSSYEKSPRSLKISDSHERLHKTSQETLDIVSYNQDFDSNKAGKMDLFSPRWDGLDDICNITPLPHPPSMATDSSASSNTRDCIKVSRAQNSQGSGRLSSVGSLRWRSSPITPMPQLGGSKFPQEPDSDSGLFDILEDDTPEILRDTPTPIKAVKASSPNQKRVSPPHSRLQELRSSSSPGLRSGRKFILQAVPSFPPLTPYSDPKGSSSDK